MFHLSSQAVLPKGDRRRLIEGKIDHRQSISAIGGRFRRNREGKKKKSKRRSEREKVPRAVLARVPSPPADHPQAVTAIAARGQFFSPRSEKRLSRRLYTYDGVSVTIPRRPKLGAMEHCNFLFGMGRIRP
ncbi:hypothetical protein GW17_00008020 [Ensete ventricosum]|nr:hypothetical protein GW17_00008020 [Ensete ventricosum]